MASEDSFDRCKLLTEWDHYFTMGVGLVFYFGLIWAAFKLRKILGRQIDTTSHKALAYKLTWVDHFFGICLWTTVIATIGLRLWRDAVHVLVLPCHHLTCLLLAVVYSNKVDHPIFLTYFYAHWQGYYAMAFADMSWYISWVELFFFWFQHILMAAIPLYYLFLSNRFRNLPNSLPDFMTIYAWTQIYHCIVLIPVAYSYSEDFNTMLCRPAELAGAGLWWREVLSFASLGIAFMLTYVIKSVADCCFQKPNKAE